MEVDHTSLQPTGAPVEDDGRLAAPLERPAAVLALPGQLAPVAWAFAAVAPGLRLAYIETGGGARRRTGQAAAAQLHAHGLLAAHLRAGALAEGERDALTTAAAIDHALRGLGCDAVVCGPGCELTDPEPPLGRGTMAVLEGAHTALALGCRVVLVARMSSGAAHGPRSISDHTLTVLQMLLAPVTVALPAGIRSPVGADLRAGLASAFGIVTPQLAAAPAVGQPARVARHDWRRTGVDLPGYAASGLPAETIQGGALTEEPLFFAAALAAGRALGELACEQRSDPREREHPALSGA